MPIIVPSTPSVSPSQRWICTQMPRRSTRRGLAAIAGSSLVTVRARIAYLFPLAATEGGRCASIKSLPTFATGCDSSR